VQQIGTSRNLTWHNNRATLLLFHDSRIVGYILFTEYKWRHSISAFCSPMATSPDFYKSHYMHFQKPLAPPVEHVGSQKYWSAF